MAVSTRAVRRVPAQLWLLPVLLITVIATALGGLLARDAVRRPGTGPRPRGRPCRRRRSAETSSRARKVQGTADATAHPLFNTVRDLLQTYFDAINGKDYDAWRTR